MKNKFFNNIAKILFFSLIASLLFNTFNEDGIPVIGEEKNYLTYEDNATTKEVLPPRLVTLSKAYELYESGEAIMIDARDNWDFSDGHIKNAMNIPEFSFRSNDAKIKSLSKDKIYIIYCSSDDCDISKRLADELYKIGFSNILFFEEGYEGWNNSGYPVETGEADE